MDRGNTIYALFTNLRMAGEEIEMYLSGKRFMSVWKGVSNQASILYKSVAGR